jgi:Leucine rich repeat
MLSIAITLLFVGLCNGLILNCTYQQENWDIFGEIYICDAKVNQVNTTDRAVIGVSQNHLSGKSDDDVKGIRFQSQALDFVPQNISEHFLNIQSLRIIRLGAFKVISKYDLQQFGAGLRQFILNYLSIEAIDGDLFSGTPNIQYISLSQNKITNVGPNLFSSLEKLNYVGFAANICFTSNPVTGQSAILELSKNLVQNCPPTFNMIERSVVEGERMETKLEQSFSEKIEPVIEEVNENLEENQAKTRRLEVRVEELERIIMEMDAFYTAKMDAWKLKFEAEMYEKFVSK